MSDTPGTDPARGRYFAMQAVRLAGVVQVLLALLVLNGKLDWPQIAGYILLLNGLFGALFAPTLMARRWKTPE